MTDTEIKKACGEMCSDNRFQLIEKYKKHLIEHTNIETAKDEVAVLDSLLFRCWQMGWLDKLEDYNRQQAEIERLKSPKFFIENEVSEKELSEMLKKGRVGVIPHIKCSIRRIDEDGIRADAIKDVISRVKKEATFCCKGAFKLNPKTPYGGKSEIIKEYRITEDKLEAIVKEMVGDRASEDKE